MKPLRELFLGVDVGSVSTNIVLVDDELNVISSQYIRTNGQPLETVKAGLRKLKAEFPAESMMRAVGITGSGRQLVGVMIGADVIKNEITAHATATIQFVPDVKTIFEIGGQDSKIIVVEDQMVTDFAMNTVCAAGTGSFLDHQAERLGIPIEDFGDKALAADRDVRIAGRCTVFAESDMIAKQQFGYSKAEIIKGLCEALVRNYINNLGRGKKLEPPFVFQGGVAANKGIKAAFEKEINHEVMIPENYSTMGALGSAILARDEVRVSGKPSQFRGFEAADLEFTPGTFECEDCPNHCEVIEVRLDKKIVARWGDRCGKWTNSVNSIT
jgi:predicted CoA-substrate-specific enzyme activase